MVLNYHYLNKLYPIDLLKDSTPYLWDIRPFVNPINNIIYIAHYTSNWKVYESFSVAILRAYYDIILWNKQDIKFDDITDKGFKLHWKNIDYSWIKYSFWKDSTGSKIEWYEFLINYIPNKHLVNKASFVDIFKWNYDPRLVKDKIVLIWASATALHDEYNAPILTEDWTWIIPWVYFHALTINTILNWKYIYYMSTYKEVMLLMIFIFIITFFLLSFSSKIWKYMNAFWIILFPLIYIVIFVFAFNKWNYIFRLPSIYIFWIIIADAWWMVWRYYYEDKWKRILKNALAQYVSQDVANEILEHFQEVKLKEWNENDVVAFFSDIEWFTSISEKLETKELFNFLRDYIKEMSDIIIENKWHINKYEWDWIMALWWDFKSEPWRIIAKQACLTAISQIKKLWVLNQKYKLEYWFEIRIRIWINYWKAKVWNIWSEWSKLEFTALWDNINLWSRLEWINKFYSTNICISESTKEMAGSDFVYRSLDEIRVKWKKNSVNIYELVWLKTEVPIERIALMRDFEKALWYYKQWFFWEALALFTTLSELWDKPSLVFINRCKELIEHNPWSEWSWIWEFWAK